MSKIHTFDVEVYEHDQTELPEEWEQGYYLVHGHDDVLWTNEIDEVLEFLRTSLQEATGRGH
jgi:hypothetical protein